MQLPVCRFVLFADIERVLSLGPFRGWKNWRGRGGELAVELPATLLPLNRIPGAAARPGAANEQIIAGPSTGGQILSYRSARQTPVASRSPNISQIFPGSTLLYCSAWATLAPGSRPPSIIAGPSQPHSASDGVAGRTGSTRGADGARLALLDCASISHHTILAYYPSSCPVRGPPDRLHQTAAPPRQPRSGPV